MKHSKPYSAATAAELLKEHGPHARLVTVCGPERWAALYVLFAVIYEEWREGDEVCALVSWDARKERR